MKKVGVPVETPPEIFRREIVEAEGRFKTDLDQAPRKPIHRRHAHRKGINHH
jgi:hypothetical protein